MHQIPLLWYLAPISSVIALAVAYIIYKTMMGSEPGDSHMQKIAEYVRTGARAYIKQQYKVVAIFFIIVFAIFILMSFGLKIQSKWVPFAFLTGGFFSGLCGFLGMSTATQASSRTAAACRKSLSNGLKIAFRSGAVMGLVVVGFGLLDISMWFFVLYKMAGLTLVETTVTMLCFGMGASLQALFARVGGGIYTKAADVGADLVGKIEAGIPEDDARNPAVIADNVGDNVGDVAGMGADLYESYCGAILASAALGAAAFHLTSFGLNAVLLPMLTAAAGILLSIIGMYFVKAGNEATQKNLLSALTKGINVSCIGILIASYFLVKYLLPNNMGMFGSITVGLAAGVIIGKSTEYFTSDEFEPTKSVARQALIGPATVIINGLSVGMISTGVPVLVVGTAILLSFGMAGGFVNQGFGLYGIGIAAVGMLSTLGITMATDAYGPIADNAGGNAEMSGLDAEVRRRTDALDSLGNTTAATGKGFAIGSAALTALALLSSYIEEVRIGLIRIGQTTLNLGHQVIEVSKASLVNFMQYYSVTLMNPKVLVGLLIGSMMTFIFCALILRAVSKTAGKMVEEVRRQFRDIHGIIEGKSVPDYAACVRISTHGAQREMMFPSLLAIVVPIAGGFVLGIAGVMGILMGGLATGFIMAIMMANAGGSWDNAKKYIEKGNLQGKGSPAHKASVVGDTVGDPFKDSAGPSLNILIKLMSMVSIVSAGLIIKYSPVIVHWLHM